MKNLTLIIVFFISISMNAQWTTDTDVNTLVAESVSEDMQAIGTSDGQTYVVFWKSVSAPTNYELRLQLLDASGNRQFGDEGMLISDNIPMSTFTVSWSVAIDANDNLYIGVTGTGDYSGRAFKLDIDGNQLWGANGVILSEAFLVTILPLESGEAIVSWIPGNQAVMQKYDVSGNAVWGSPQPVVSGSSKTAPGNLFELSDGDYIMVFHTYNSGINSTLYAQRYDTDGLAQWTSPTQLSNKTTANNAFYSGTQDVDIVYYGYKGSHSNRFDSYLQRINPDGTLPWGINGMDFDVNETDMELDTKIAFSSGSQYVWSICTYSNSNQSEFGEYIQKFDKVTGARQFTDNAKMVYAISSDDKVHASDLYLVDNQPFFLLKTGFDNGATPTTLDVLLLDNNGDFAWPEEIRPIATYAANKKRTHLTETANGQSVAVFIEDKTTGLKIYAQNFINELSPPAQPSLISPPDESMDIPLMATFSWGVAQGAETYHIQIAEDNTFNNLIADESGIINTNYDFTLPDYEATYYWRVMASNSVGDSDWSEVWSFTTVIDVPAQPILISPVNGATDVLLVTTFSWEVAERAETYRIQIAEDDAFTNLIADVSGFTNTSYELTLPDYLTTYYWHVMASNSTGDSEWSEAWSFTTVDLDVPAQPTLISPLDGAIDVPLMTMFSWEVAQEAETYHIQIAEDDAFTNLIADESGIINTSFDFALPEYLTTYYWRVMASNSAGDSEWSEVWSFTTVDLDVPAQPILVSPLDGATDIPLVVTFNWEVAQEAETYHIQIAEDITFDNLIADESGIINTSYEFSLPDYLTTYYWRVLAHNSAGDSEWSEVWSFTTELAIGIDELISKEELKVYPNPARSFVHIDFNSPINSEVQLVIYNSMGNMLIVSKENIIKGKNSFKLDIEKLPTGNYYYHITGKESGLSGKFFKIK